MTKYARNYRLKGVGKFWTMFHESSRGDKIASIILPAWCETKSSPTRCNVDAATGLPTGASGKLHFIKPSTALECADVKYRERANRNAEVIREMSLIPGVPFSFSDYLDAWIEDITCQQVRVFFGGDGCIMGGLNAILSIAYCARRNKSKLFYTRTDSLDALEHVYNTAFAAGLEFPRNMLLCYENTKNDPDAETRLAACGADSPIVTFSLQDGVDDMSYFPLDDDDFVIRIPENCIMN